MNEKELLKLKGEIDEAKEQVAELKGKRDHLMSELKEKWHCKSVEEAEGKLKEMEAEIKQLDKQIEEGVREIEEKYGN